MPPTSEVYIQATGTDPTMRAQAAFRADQHRLLAALRAKTALLTELDLGPGAREAAHAGLTDFCAEQVRRYLAACDRTLYATASGATETRLLVRALRLGADGIDQHIDALAAADSAGSENRAAQAIEAALAAHLAATQAVLLSALADLPGADLPTVIADFQLLLAGGQLDTPDVVDVRDIPHGQRHPRIFTRFARLAPGQSFTLVNNHDPKPLRREFQAAHPGAFTWEYLEAGPEQWQIRIGRETRSDA